MEVQKVLARGITASCVLAALAAAGPALGGDSESTRYSAEFELGGKISFVRKEAKKPKVAHIKIKKMAADCEGHAAAIGYKIYGNTRILADGSFAVRSEDGEGGKAVVRGEFSDDLGRVEGTARIHGKIKLADGSRRSCETGKRPYVATISG